MIYCQPKLLALSPKANQAYVKEGSTYWVHAVSIVPERVFGYTRVGTFWVRSGCTWELGLLGCGVFLKIRVPLG